MAGWLSFGFALCWCDTFAPSKGQVFSNWWFSTHPVAVIVAAVVVAAVLSALKIQHIFAHMHEAINSLAGLLGLMDVKASISIHELLGSQPGANQWAS